MRQHAISRRLCLLALSLCLIAPAAPAMAKSNRGSLYGSVSGGDGAPVAIVVFSGKTLPTAKQKKKPVAVSNIDGTGHFLIPSLAPGDYVVLAVEQGGGSATARATIVAGKATAVFLNLPPEAS